MIFSGQPIRPDGFLNQMFKVFGIIIDGHPKERPKKKINK
jgi:hypothetical protein